MRKYWNGVIILCTILISVTRVVAHEEGDLTNVHTDPLTLILVFFSSIAASIIPLLFGAITTLKLLEKETVLSEHDLLIPKGIALGVLTFLLYDDASLGSVFAFSSNQLLSAMLKMILIIIAFPILSMILRKSQSEGNKSMYIFYLWLVGIGIHTVGEGIIMGYNLALGFAEAFDPFGISSYVLHKIAEGAIAALIFSMTKESEKKKFYKPAIITSFTIVLGAFMGYLAQKLDITGIVNFTNIFSFTVGFIFILFIIPFIIPDKEHITEENYFLSISIGLFYMFVGLILHEL